MDIVLNDGMRLTRQRKIILDSLRSVKTHPDAKQVYEMARKKMPSISFGTVYRNLRVLKKLGLILELDYAISRYDGDTSEHYHFTCEKCKRIIDIFKPILDKNRFHIKHKIKSFRLELFGVCSNCLNR